MLLVQTFILYSMTCTRGCSYSLLCSWWWTRRTPETCRLHLQ